MTFHGQFKRISGQMVHFNGPSGATQRTVRGRRHLHNMDKLGLRSYVAGSGHQISQLRLPAAVLVQGPMPCVIPAAREKYMMI